MWGLGVLAKELEIGHPVCIMYMLCVYCVLTCIDLLLDINVTRFRGLTKKLLQKCVYGIHAICSIVHTCTSSSL